MMRTRGGCSFLFDYSAEQRNEQTWNTAFCFGAVGELFGHQCGLWQFLFIATSLGAVSSNRADKRTKGQESTG